jgi:thioredoxin 1
MITEIQSREEFKTLTESGKALVEFYSKTCGPCKMLSFVLKDVDKTLDNPTIVVVDFDEYTDLKESYDVKGFPTMLMLKDGQEIQRMQGLKQKRAIIEMIENA